MADDVRQSETAFAIGEDLYGVSVAELEERVGILQAEITRIERELTKKQSELSAAELIFGKKTP
jgi:uncharacterized small protein (DUF1192 family)